MYFASKYIYRYDQSDEEEVSDDEFRDGMIVSSSEDDGEGGNARAGHQAASHCLTTRSMLGGGPKTHKRRSDHTNSTRNQRSNMMACCLRTTTVESDSEINQAEPKSHQKLKKKKSHWKATALKSSDSRNEANHRYRRADTNVVSVTFDTLISPSHMHTGDAVYCSGCRSVLSCVSELTHMPCETIWRCEFCGVVNIVDLMDEEKPADGDVTYMLEPSVRVTASGPSGSDQSLVIFCVDISGSMCITTEIPGTVHLRGSATPHSDHSDDGPQYLPRERRDVTYVSRLQAVQAAVDQQVQDLGREFPQRRVMLVAFNNEVNILGETAEQSVCISGDKLKNQDALQEIGSRVQLPRAVKDIRAILSQKIFALEEGGSTAIGPTLVTAVAIAAQCAGSKVIICTDGKANVGLGSLESLEKTENQEKADRFYTSLGQTAVDKSVSISVISIKGTDCNLGYLGKVADMTGGQVTIVDPLKLTEEFSNILSDRIIATNVTATVLLHKSLYFRNEQSASNLLTKVIGNVTSKTEFTFEYGVHRSDKGGQPRMTATTATPLEAMDETDIKTSEAVSDEFDQPCDPDEMGAEGDERQNTRGQGTSDGTAAKEFDEGGGDGEDDREWPFQLQISYTDIEGCTALRVISRTRPVTKDRSLAEKDIDLELLGAHAARSAAQLALSGEYTASRGVALMQQRLAWRYCSKTRRSEDRDVYHSAYSRISDLEHGVNTNLQLEILRHGATYSDSEEDDCAEERGQVALVNVDAGKLVNNPSKSRALVLHKKKKLQRTSEASDDFSTNLYMMKNVSSKKTAKK